MDAVEFLKNKKRMCDSYITCIKCPLYKLKKTESLIFCKDVADRHPKEVVEIVEKWSEEHPSKTMLKDFFEKFPDAPMSDDGTPRLCPYDVGYETNTKCPSRDCENDLQCEECWNRPLEKED